MQIVTVLANSMINHSKQDIAETQVEELISKRIKSKRVRNSE